MGIMCSNSWFQRYQQYHVTQKVTGGNDSAKDADASEK
jgi:hypothetical protein